MHVLVKKSARDVLSVSDAGHGRRACCAWKARHLAADWHRACFHQILVVDRTAFKATDCKREAVTQLLDRGTVQTGGRLGLRMWFGAMQYGAYMFASTS